MRSIGMTAALVGVYCMAVNCAYAQNPSYKALLEQGFEVRAMVLVPADAATRIATSAQPDAVAITLQKGPVSASCWMTFTAWNSHVMSSVPCTLMK